MAGPREDDKVTDGAPARPDHRTVSMWQDVCAAINHIRMAEFYLGHLPAKPSGNYDDEAVRLQLADAHAVLFDLSIALQEQAS